MKVFGAVTLVVFLCCLEVALSYPNPAAKTQRGPYGRLQAGGGEQPQQRQTYFEQIATSQQGDHTHDVHV